MQQSDNHKNNESSPPLKETEKTPAHSRHDSEDHEDNKDILLKEKEQELEQKNQDLEKNLQKLMQQNEKLSTEIKELRGQIMSAMERSKKKPNGPSSKHEPEDATIKQLKSKIDAQAKEILGFQREISQIQEKTDGKKTKEKIVDLENVLKFKEAELEKLNADRKTLEEIRKSHQNIIESIKSEKDYTKKVSLYQEDIRKLKEEIREQQKKEAEYEKEQRKQHEYLAVLEQRYREACKKNGVSASLNFTRAEQQNEDLVKQGDKKEKKEKIQSENKINQTKPKEKDKKTQENDKKTEKKVQENDKKNLQPKPQTTQSKTTQKPNEKIPSKPEKSLINLNEFDEEKLPTEVTEENYKLLVSKYQELQALRQSLYKKYKTNEDSCQIKLKELELERKVLANRLKEKETEANIAISRLNEIKRLAKQASLPQHLEVLDKSMLGKSVIQDHIPQKKTLFKHLMDTRRRKTKREVVGELAVEFSDVILMDDGEVLADHLTLDFQIVEVLVYHDGKNKIYGFKASYLIDGEKVEGNDNVMKQVKENNTTKTTVLKMSENGDSLKFITGFYREFIEYMKLESVKGQSIVVGALQGEKAKDLKEFCIDIKSGDVGTVLFGAAKFNSASNNPNDYLLSNFGVEIVNNNIYQKWLNRKKGKEENIEESILVEEEGALQRRGLVLGKKLPLKKKY